MSYISDSCLKRIIIVEKDCDFCDSLADFLQSQGYDVTSLGSAIDVYEAIKKRDYDLAIINPVLPDQDGIVLAKYLSSNTYIRVLIISDHSSIEEKIRGYESGAAMYLVKPVDVREVFFAATGLLQSNHTSNKEAKKNPLEDHDGQWILKVDEWMVVTPEKKTISLTGKEYMLLEQFAKEPQGSIVSKEQLLGLLNYPINKYGNHSLESLVYRLRKKISPLSETPIKTINTFGYSFIAKIEMF